MIRVCLPHHLRTLAGVRGEVLLDADDPPTADGVVDALETAFPALRGTIRDPATRRRRPFVRYFACEADLSLDPPGTPLPASVATGRDALYIVGAMAGG